MDSDTWVDDILIALQAGIKKKGSSTCMGCLVQTPSEDIASLGIYVPNAAGILGKTRVVGYALCHPCVKLSDEILSKSVEGNIIRAGVMLDPREFRLEDLQSHNP